MLIANPKASPELLKKFTMTWMKMAMNRSKKMNLLINNSKLLKIAKTTSNFWPKILKLWMRK